MKNFFKKIERKINWTHVIIAEVIVITAGVAFWLGSLNAATADNVTVTEPTTCYIEETVTEETTEATEPETISVVENMRETLRNKSMGWYIEPDAEAPFYYYKVNDKGYGIACAIIDTTDTYDKRYLFETSDSKNWYLLEECEIPPFCENACSYIGKTVIMSYLDAYSNESFFRISHDRGHSFETVTASQVLGLREKLSWKVIPVKLFEKENTIIYGWCCESAEDADNHKNYLYIAEYDKNMKQVRRIAGSKAALKCYIYEREWR